MQAFKKIIVGYFVFYGVTSFLNNLAQHYVQTQVLQAKLEGIKGTDIVNQAKQQSGGYM